MGSSLTIARNVQIFIGIFIIWSCYFTVVLSWKNNYGYCFSVINNSERGFNV